MSVSVSQQALTKAEEAAGALPLLLSDPTDARPVTLWSDDESCLVESCLRQQPCQFITTIEAIHTRLRHFELGNVFFGDDIQGQAAARFHDAPDFLQRRCRLFPEIDDVRAEHFVEAVVGIWQRRGVNELHFNFARSNGRGIAPRRLLQHCLGEIYPGDPTLRRKPRHPLNAIARSEADFQYMIGGLDLELFDRPFDPLAIDPKEQPPQPPEESGRLANLLCPSVPEFHDLVPDLSSSRRLHFIPTTSGD